MTEDGAAGLGKIVGMIATEKRPTKKSRRARKRATLAQDLQGLLAKVIVSDLRERAHPSSSMGRCHCSLVPFPAAQGCMASTEQRWIP